jgi:hypothetical protein
MTLLIKLWGSGKSYLEGFIPKPILFFGKESRLHKSYRGKIKKTEEERKADHTAYMKIYRKKNKQREV